MLEKQGFDLTKAIAAHPNSLCQTSSKFRDSSVIDPIFAMSPKYDKLSTLYNTGIKYHLPDMYTEETSDLAVAILTQNNRGKEDYLQK